MRPQRLVYPLLLVCCTALIVVLYTGTDQHCVQSSRYEGWSRENAISKIADHIQTTPPPMDYVNVTVLELSEDPNIETRGNMSMVDFIDLFQTPWDLQKRAWYYLYSKTYTGTRKGGLIREVAAFQKRVGIEGVHCTIMNFQKSRIKELCAKHFFTREQKFPDTEESITEFHSHLLFDEEKQVIFCFVPKVGCTNMKRLMLYMSDNLPMYTVDWPWVDYAKFILPAMKRASFLNKTLTHGQKQQMISKYYKYMMVRHPLERLVSAYRDKLESPLEFERLEKFPELVKVEILQRYRPKELRFWRHIQKVQPQNISVSFSEFCRYLTETDSSKINEHFVPSMDLCHPCLMEYNFYGNFRNYSHDSAQLIKKFETDPQFYRDKSLHKPFQQTRQKLQRYYGTLNHREKLKLFGRLYDELLFYYTLYPTERKSHIEILGIDLPVLFH